MNYSFLSAPLHPIADAVVAFLEKNRGLRKFEAESPIHAQIQFRPTLQATSDDHYLICIEVAESFTDSLDSFILDCVNRQLPVKLYLCIDSDVNPTEYKRLVSKAKTRGVGIIVVDGQHCTVLNEAVALPLTGLRSVDAGSFPRKFRTALAQAESAFKGGDPVKGCAIVYEEIEGLWRRISLKIDSKGLWKQPPRRVSDYDKAPWAKIVREVMDGYDYTDPRLSKLNQSLIGRVLGVTEHRNAVDHKPKNRTALQKRDTELRTRFENGVDVLKDLVDATKGLKP